MEKTKMPYEEAKLELILLSHSDILTASGDCGEDPDVSAPNRGDWDHGGWIDW